MSATFIDLFAGCGGLSLGLSSAGLRPCFAVEAHPDAFATYSANLLNEKKVAHSWPDWLPKTHHDIVELLAKYDEDLRGLRGTIDLVAGGPPCQGFSTNGRRDPSDPRNQLVLSYLSFIELVAPKMVLLENVRGFTSMRHEDGGTYSKFVADRIREMGYDVWSELMHANEWGVPQRRPRFFLVAVRKGLLKGVNPFERIRVARRSFLTKRGLDIGPTTATQALHDLETSRKSLIADPEFGPKGFKSIQYVESDAPSAFVRQMRKNASGQPTDLRLPRHAAETRAQFKRILGTCTLGRNLSPSDRARLGIQKRSTTPMHPDAPSPTITTLPDDMIHYSEPRILTVREQARLQSFPDWFSFKGPYTTGGARRRTACPRYTQVGNAVPPLLAEALGETLLGLIGIRCVDNLDHLADRVDVHSKRLSNVPEVFNANIATIA